MRHLIFKFSSGVKSDVSFTFDFYPCLDDVIADIYVSVVSYTHQVAAKGWFIAMVSTTVETATPEEEIRPGLALLGNVRQK